MSLNIFRDHKFFGGGRTNGVRSGNVSLFVLLLIFFIATSIPSSAQTTLNGTFNVTENWSVTIHQVNGGSQTFSGHETGTLVIVNGQYSLIDHSGIPGGDTSNTQIHSISGGPPYTSIGEYPFAGSIITNGIYTVFHLGFFSVAKSTSFAYAGSLVPGGSSVFTTVGQSLNGLSGSGVSDLNNYYYFTATSSSTLVQQDSAPQITSGPDSQAVLVGSNATFYVSATGNPAPSYQWQFNGSIIPLATLNTYTVTNVQAAEEGDYSVIVSNKVGSVTSSNASLVISPPQAPVITGQPQNQTVLVGSYATFYVSATGLPAPTYQWQFNGTNIPLATDSIYSLNAQFNNQGNYSVVISNTVGSTISSNATLTVNGIAPSITVQPQNEAVIIGSNATMTVTATALPAPGYQWLLNGTNIDLATGSSYTVTNAQLSCAGNYSVIVSNSVGSVVSTNGYLSVAAAPFFYSEVSLGSSWCWMDQDNDTNHIFGYFNYSPTNFPFLFHIDLGEEYFFDAENANSGGYFYDFGDGAFFYTEPGLFPFLYDFHLNTWVWYDPDPAVGYGRYTSKPRWFYNFSNKTWINHL